MNKSLTNPLQIAGLVGLIALLVGTSPAHAQVAGRDTSADNEMLLGGDTLVVTASKTPQRLSDSPSAVSVITEEQIRDSGATTIPDLLRSVPGVDVVEENRSQQNVAIRGFDNLFADKLLVMVDGRSIYQVFDGSVFWEQEPLLLSRIKRIEIVRGPGSALYGANAFGGVINIITKTPQEMASSEKPHTFRASRGDQNSILTEGTVSQTTAKDGAGRGIAFTVGVGYHSTDGYGQFKPGAVRDSSSVPILTADVQELMAHGSLQFSAALTHARTDFPTPYAALPDTDWQTERLALTYSEDKTASPVTAHLYSTFFRQNTSLNNVPSDYSSSLYELEVEQQRHLSAQHNIVYGLSERFDQGQSSITGPDQHRESDTSLYAQDDFRVGPETHLFGGLRVDHHSLYGTNVTPRLSLVRHLPNAQTLRLSYGTAFRAPTLLDSYYDATLPLGGGLTQRVVGNPGLNPERVRSIEAAYRRDFKAGSISLSIYHNELSGLVTFAPVEFAPPPAPPGIPILVSEFNAASAHADGVEFDSDFALTRCLRVRFNYAYDNAVTQGHQADLSPRNKVNVGCQADLSAAWSAYAMLHYVDGDVYHDPALHRYTVGSYTQVDTNLAYRFGGRRDPSWTASLAATNVFNVPHLELPVTNAPGQPSVTAPHSRTLWMTLGGKF